MQTMQQQRAAFALERVQGARNQVSGKEFTSYASALPAMIHMNGLGQAAAFYRSKYSKQEKNPSADTLAYRRLYDLLSDWLCRNDQPFAAHDDLLEGITGSDMDAYLLAQAEAQALMDWVKKFAKAFMGESGEQQGAEQ